MDIGAWRAPGEERSVIGRAGPERKGGGIPWGEWDAATRDTAFRGWVGCRNARIEVRPGMSIRTIADRSKRSHLLLTDISPGRPSGIRSTEAPHYRR